MNWQEMDIYAATAEGLFFYDAKGNRLEPVLAQDIRPATGHAVFRGCGAPEPGLRG
jgi:hypothetical protein